MFSWLKRLFRREKRDVGTGPPRERDLRDRLSPPVHAVSPSLEKRVKRSTPPVEPPSRKQPDAAGKEIRPSAAADPMPEPETIEAPPVGISAREKAAAHVDLLQNKISKLADDFASGEINQEQFQRLYAHYRQEMKTVETLLEVENMDEDWQNAVSNGQSMLIRQKHAARATGYAIYENESGMPLSTLGKFDLDPDLLVPMLSSYRAATKEIFGAGVRETEIEGGRTLCFVPGKWTTLMAIFTAEPSSKQLKFLEWLHHLFEKANRHHLPRSPINVDALIFPQEQYLGRWRR